MIIVSLIDYIWILNFYWIIYAAAILSLLSVLVFGHTANGAKRWIDLGFTTFQPSELAKILLILFFARFLMDHKDDINDAVTLIKYCSACRNSTCFNSGRAEPFYYDLHCTCHLPVDLCWRTELQIYRNCTSYISSSGYYLFKYRRPAKPAIFERLSAKAYSCFPGA